MNTQFASLKSRSQTLILFLFLFLFGSLSNATAGARAKEMKFTVANYNIRGIPTLINKLQKWGGDGRFEKIAAEFNEKLAKGTAPDVLVLNEVFSDSAKRAMKKIKYPYRVESGSMQGNQSNDLYGNGLMILSRYPITDQWDIDFGDAEGSDSGFFAWTSRRVENRVSKGMIAVKIKVPRLPQEILVFGTHLISQSELDKARTAQVNQILNSLVPETPAHSTLSFWSGDFNFKPRHPSYHAFVKGLEAQDFKVQDLGEYCVSNLSSCETELTGKADKNNLYKNSNDRQFWSISRDSTVNQIEVQPTALRILLGKNRIQGNTKPLSDHFLYQGEYLLKW